VEWLLKTKLPRKTPKWKPSCFIVDDARLKGLALTFDEKTQRQLSAMCNIG
jgi:hypothetical protein